MSLITVFVSVRPGVGAKPVVRDQEVRIGSTETVYALKERVLFLFRYPFPIDQYDMCPLPSSPDHPHPQPLPDTAKLTDGTHMEMVVTATDTTVAHMLRDLLHHHQRATSCVGDGLQMDELSLLFCYRYGSTVEEALRLVGSEYGFGEFIRSRDELRLVNNTVWLASESESDVNGGGGEDGDVSCQLTPEEERIVRKELERYLAEMAKDQCVYRMDLTALCGRFIEEHHVAVSTLIGGRPDVFLSRTADTFVLDRNGRVALKKYADLCDVSEEPPAPAEPSTRTHTPTQTTVSATPTAPSLPSPHMTTTSRADAAPPSSHPTPSSHSRSTDGSSCFDCEVDEALMCQSAGQPGGAEETVRTMAADGEQRDGDGQAPALSEASSSSSISVLPHPHTQKPSLSQADDFAVPTPTHTQGVPDQPAPFPSLDQQPHRPHTHTSTTPTSTPTHQHQHQQYPRDVTVTWWRPVQQPQQQPVAVPVAGASRVRRVGEVKVAEGVYSELHLKISSRAFNSRVAQDVKALVEVFESDSCLNLESISKGGAANNGTAVSGQPVECDIILNTEGLPTKNFDTWYPPLCRVLGRMVTMLLPPEHVTDLYILPNAVTFTYKGMLSVSLKAAPVFETYGELMQCLGESPPRVREYLDAAVTPYRCEYVSRQPAPVRVTIRLIKHWRNQQVWSNVYSRPSDYLLELLAIYVHQQAKQLKDQQTALSTLLCLMSRFASLRIIWTSHYSDSDIWWPLMRQQPLILDPVNPFLNLADPQALDYRELVHLASSSTAGLPHNDIPPPAPPPPPPPPPPAPAHPRLPDPPPYAP